MKKALLFLTAAALVFALAGCGNRGASSSSGSVSAAGSVEVVAEPVDFQLTGYDCQVSIPSNLAGTYDLEVYDDGSGVSVRSTENLGYGGTVFAIWLVTDEQAADPDYFVSCDGTPTLLGQDAENGNSFYLVHPYTDVQYGPDDDVLKDQYQAILDAEGEIGKTFTWTANSAAGPVGGTGSAAAAVWTDAYTNVLASVREAFPEYAGLLSYSIYDMNADGVPELFTLVGSNEANFAYSVYTYQDGKPAVPVGDFGGGHSSLCGLGGDGVLVQYVSQGEELLTRYTLTGDALSGGEELSSTSDGNIHELTILPSYELDDVSGLSWTANAAEDNQAIVDSLAA